MPGFISPQTPRRIKLFSKLSKVKKCMLQKRAVEETFHSSPDLLVRVYAS